MKSRTRRIFQRNVLFEVLDAFINGGFVVRERDRRGNFLFLLLSAFGLVLVSAFAGRFMGFLAVLGDPPQMQTIEEVASQVTRVYAPDRTQDHFKGAEENDVIWKLLDNDYWGLLRRAGVMKRGPAVPPSAPVTAVAEEPRPLQLQALVEPGAVLGAGLLAATVAFLIELALHRRAFGRRMARARLFVRRH